jgi:hypothetical protein
VTTNKQILMGIGVFAISMLSSAMAQTAEQPTQKPAPAPKSSELNTDPKQAQQKAAPSASGMTIFIDPVTKQIRQPDSGEANALVNQSGPSVAATAEPQTLTGPGNAVGIVMESSSQVFMVVSKSADGKLKSDCVTGEQTAKALVEGKQIKKETLDVK